MGSELFHTNLAFRTSILSMQALCDSHGFPLFVDLISDKNVDITQKSTVQIQLAIVAVQIALDDLWRSWGVQFDLVIGHSLGEYAALFVAGVLSLTDVLGLVGERALLVEQHCTAHAYAMLAVAASAETVGAQINRPEVQFCSIACYNSPSATVVSGPLSDIQSLDSSLRSAGKACTLVPVSYGFHSAQLDPILDTFEKRAELVQFHAPNLPVISTVTAGIIQDAGNFTSSYLAQQTRNPVHFYQALKKCSAEGIIDENTIWLELGPHSTCGSMIKATLGTANVHASMKSRESNWKTISAAAATMYTSQISFSWPNFHREYTDCLRLLDLPKYVFDTKNFWRVYKEDRVEKIQGALPPKSSPGKISSSLNFVKKESTALDGISITFETLLADEGLYDAIQGHLVDNVPICPSSVFCDMALTAAKYIYSKMHKGTDKVLPHLMITDLSLNHPVVVATPRSKQSLQVSAVQAAQKRDRIDINFSLHDASSSSVEIGHCQVSTFTTAEWTEQWSDLSFFIRSRMDSLVKSVKGGHGDHLRRSIIYKLFADLVRYGEKYQGIEEIFWDERSNDAVAHIELEQHSGPGDFHHLPYWADPLVHVAGFVLNAKRDVVTSDDKVYLASGMKKMQVHGQLSAGKKYTSYVRSHDADEHGLSRSDVYVFDQDEPDLLVAFSSLVFQQMPRAVLHRILRKDDGRVSISYDPVSAPTTSVPKVEETTPGQENLADQLIAVVAAETGVDLNDMISTADFASMGVDSLMSITIIDKIQKKFDIQLEANFFQENLTVADARKTLGHNTTSAQSEHDTTDVETKAGDTPSSGKVGSESWTRVSPVDSITTEEPAKPAIPENIHLEPQPAAQNTQPQATKGNYKSNVILIHGRKTPGLNPLFLITDGAGSATAYIHLSRFPSGRPLYALESPFVRRPEQYNLSVEETAKLYIAAIKKTQPEGPYLIGGWSAGGAHAYEVAKQLLDSGDTISRLIIIDMKIPKSIPDGLDVTLEFLEKVGLTTGINRADADAHHALGLTGMSDRLKAHLLGTIKSLMVYTAVPMEPTRRPEKTFVIWAEYGIAEIVGEAAFKDIAGSMGFKEDVGEGKNVMEDEDVGFGEWFYSRRRNFGPNGWDKLLGDVECRSLKADHFSLVTTAANELGKLLQEAVGE